MTDHKEIWLQPWCADCAKHLSEGRNWCSSDQWGECWNCGAKATRYVLAETKDTGRVELSTDEAITELSVAFGVDYARAGRGLEALRDQHVALSRGIARRKLKISYLVAGEEGVVARGFKSEEDAKIYANALNAGKFPTPPAKDKP